MKITDPLKRRAEFVARSAVRSEATLVIAGDCPDDVVTLTISAGLIAASTPTMPQVRAVEKIQLLGRPASLTIDFAYGAELSRIVADVEALDASALHSQLAAIIKDTSILFFSRIGNEN